MQYATLGNTGLVVSRLAFGAMTFTSGNQDIATIYKVGAQARERARRPRARCRRELLRHRRRLRRRRVRDAARPGAQVPPQRGRDRDQGRLSQRPGRDAVGPVTPPHPVVGRREPEAPRHRLDRRLHRAPRGSVHAARRDARGIRRGRALRQSALHRLLELVRVESGRGARDPEGEQLSRRSRTARCTTRCSAATSSAT